MSYESNNITWVVCLGFEFLLSQVPDGGKPHVANFSVFAIAMENVLVDKFIFKVRNNPANIRLDEGVSKTS